MKNQKRFLLALLICVTLALSIFAATASAGTWSGSCWVGPSGSGYTRTCTSPFNYWVDHVVTNRSAGGTIYCYVYTSFGWPVGGSGYVPPSTTKHFAGSGYNAITCEYNNGVWPIGVTMYSHT